MKTSLSEKGELIISAENKLEAFALQSWIDQNIIVCNGNFKEGRSRYFNIDVRILNKETLIQKLKRKIQVFRINIRYRI